MHIQACTFQTFGRLPLAWLSFNKCKTIIAYYPTADTHDHNNSIHHKEDTKTAEHNNKIMKNTVTKCVKPTCTSTSSTAVPTTPTSTSSKHVLFESNHILRRGRVKTFSVQAYAVLLRKITQKLNGLTIKLQLLPASTYAAVLMRAVSEVHTNKGVNQPSVTGTCPNKLIEQELNAYCVRFTRKWLSTSRKPK